MKSIYALAMFAGCTATAPGWTDEPPSVDDGAGSGDQAASTGTAGDGSGSSNPVTAADATTWKVLDHDYQAQVTGYWCGPTATHIALSTRMTAPSQSALASELGTTTNGTDAITQVTGVLNNHLGARYASVEMPNDPPTQAQHDQLWRDVVLSIDAGHGMVANIVAPPSNHPPGYPDNETIYHYFSIVGYNPANMQVYIADPADFSGNTHYWLSLDQLATLIPPKGYSTYRCGVGRTGGAIDSRYQALGGCTGFLGPALTDDTTAPDGAGHYNVFQNGSIYWSPSTGAFEVHGAIRDKWRDLGWEAGALGYPVSNETAVPDGVGRFSVFEHGSIYWTPQLGAHEVHGAIRDKWKDLGWEAGPLGYPTSDEYAVSEGRRSDFEHGSLIWNSGTNTVTVSQ